MFKPNEKERQMLQSLALSDTGEVLIGMLERFSDHQADVRNLDDLTEAKIQGAIISSKAILQLKDLIKKPVEKKGNDNWE